jgi:hypothetical protein
MNNQELIEQLKNEGLSSTAFSFVERLESIQQYDIHANGRKLNEFPIEAETEEQLKAFIEIGLGYDLIAVDIKPAEVIKVNDVTFKKSSKNTFVALDKGVKMYDAFIEKGKVLYIDLEGVWDTNTKTPLKKFELLPNFNLTF